MPADHFEFVKMHEARRTEDYLFEVEEFKQPNGCCFYLCHIRVLNFVPSVYKRILHEWKLFREFFPAPLWATGEVEDDKWIKFVTRFGFKPQMKIICNNGDERTLYLHSGNFNVGLLDPNPK